MHSIYSHSKSGLIIGALAALVFSLSGCIGITKPSNGFVSQSSTVDAEVGFRSQVKSGTFRAELDGNDVTALFSPQPPAATLPAAQLTGLALGQHTLTVSADVLQYWLLFPFYSRASTSVTFSVVQPSLGFAPIGPVSVDVGGTGMVRVTAAIAPAAATTVMLSSSAPGTATIPASTSIAANATQSAPVNLSGIQAGAATITASAPGYTAASLAVAVPQPDFEVTITSADQSVAWGNAATFTVAVESRRGFTSAVNLTAVDLPLGATGTFSPTSVTPVANGTATATLTIATTEAVTAPGTTRFRVEGRDPTNRRRDDDARVTVLRKPGAFSATIFPLQTGNSTCGLVTATIVATSGPAVQFTSPLGTTNPAAAFSGGYDLAPNCRVALVLPPVAPNGQIFTNLYNLQFPPSTGAAGINSPYNFQSGPFDARFSPDGSIVAIISQANPNSTVHAFAITLFDIINKRSSRTEFFDGFIQSLILAGDEVTVAGSHTAPFTFQMDVP